MKFEKPRIVPIIEQSMCNGCPYDVEYGAAAAAVLVVMIVFSAVAVAAAG